MTSKRILIGCDPEVFILNSEDGKPLSAEGLIGGTKHQPIWNKAMTHSLQEDNVMAEIGIKAANTKEDFSNRIQQALDDITHVKGFKISLSANENFEKAMLETPQASESGCTPDFNVYERSMNTPVDLSSITTRYAGGHIHIGLGKRHNTWMHEYDPELLIKAMDWYVGLPLMRKEGVYKSKLQQYRRLGNFRVKPYGVEYRSPSNSWIFSDKSRKDIFKRTTKAVEMCNKLSTRQLIQLENTYQASL
jgi:hypothetical protein